jgi:hypothetical protein
VQWISASDSGSNGLTQFDLIPINESIFMLDNTLAIHAINYVDESRYIA